jgi:hypothetical protein
LLETLGAIWNVLNEIEFTPKKDTNEEILIKWKLLSRDFSANGQLRIIVQPRFIENERVMYVIKEEDCKNEIEYSEKMFKGHYTLNY